MCEPVLSTNKHLFFALHDVVTIFLAKTLVRRMKRGVSGSKKNADPAFK